MAKSVFSLVCAPEVEEKLLDMLLTNFSDEVFTSTPVFSHGTAAGRMSPREQVMGRSRSVYVQILVTEEEAETLRRLLLENFAGTGIRYWTTAVGVEGEVA
jgi:hypothetical protein